MTLIIDWRPGPLYEVLCTRFGLEPRMQVGASFWLGGALFVLALLLECWHTRKGKQNTQLESASMTGRSEALTGLYRTPELTERCKVLI